MKKLISIRDDSEIKVGDIIKGKNSKIHSITIKKLIESYDTRWMDSRFYEFFEKVQLYIVDTELSPEVERTPHINKNEDTLYSLGMSDIYHEEDWNRVIASTDTSLGLPVIGNVKEALDLIGEEVETEYVSKVKVINPACGDFGEIIEIVPDFFGKKDQWYDKNRPNCFYDREELEFGYSEVIVKPKKVEEILPKEVVKELSKIGEYIHQYHSDSAKGCSHGYKKEREEAEIFVIDDICKYHLNLVKEYSKGYKRGKEVAEKEANDSYAEAHLKGYVAAEESMKPIIKQLNKAVKENTGIKFENSELRNKLRTTNKKYFKALKRKEELEDLIEYSEKAMFTKEGILEVYDMYLRYQRKEKEIISFREFVETYVKY